MTSAWLHRSADQRLARRAGLALIAALISVAVFARPASAQSDFAEEVAGILGTDGYVLEEGAELDDRDARRLSGSLVDDGVGFVVLAQGITPSAQRFAEDVYDVLAADRSRIDAVVVVTPDELGAAAADRFGGDAAERALDAVDPSDRAATIIEDFADALLDGAAPAAPTPTEAPAAPAAPADDAGGGGGFLVVLLVLVAIGAAAFFFMKRSGAKVRARNLAKAKAEVEAQLSGLGSLIYDLDERLQLSDNESARRRFEQASSDYADLMRAIDEADSGPEVADVAAEVDDVKWALEAIEADLDGRSPPPRPTEVDRTPPVEAPTRERSSGPRRGPDLGPLGGGSPRAPRRRRRAPVPGGDVPGIDRSTACFFDPGHRAGTVPVSIESSRGQVAAFVCRDCARRLEAGERPAPRLVDVGERQVIAAAAPTGYGGLGLSLPDLFNIRTGQMTEPLDYDWRREIDRPSSAGARRRRRRTEALPGRSSAGRRRSRRPRRR